MDHNLGFEENRQFFSLATTAESINHKKLTPGTDVMIF
jgi:hypothetical protein